MDRGIVFRTEILGVDAFEKVFQLAHVQLDDDRIGEDHDSVPQAPAKIPPRPSDECGGFSCRRSIRMDTPYPKPQKSKRSMRHVFVPAARARSPLDKHRHQLPGADWSPGGLAAWAASGMPAARRTCNSWAAKVRVVAPGPGHQRNLPLDKLAVAKPKTLAVINQDFQHRGRPVAEHEHPAVERIVPQHLFADAGQAVDAAAKVRPVQRPPESTSEE